ncbi:hypothetical protein Ocin01_14964 [Orchesella cincta]|uniref:F-box domain-containing protein n=1 Tax=Orchesella cincta TaxID=48709 RepID=A0A1D2MFG0_ORCCI|nr:hypothetical protein Ocin01_14964 [Orchesella cincta]
MKKVDLGGVKCNTKAASKRRKFKNEEAERDGEDLGDVSYFQHRLPIELVEMILKLVLETDLKSALNARLVCQEWNHLLQDKLVYSGALMDKNISNFVNLDSSIVFKTFALGKLATSRIARVPTFRRLTNRKHTYDPELFQRSVNHLIIGGDAGTMLKMHVGKESLPYSLSSGFAEDHEVLVRVRESVSGADLINIIPQLRDVETLTISSIAFLSIPLMVLKKLDFSRFNTITKLDVCVGKSTDGFKMCLFLRKAEFPHLTDLYFRVYHSCVHFRVNIAIFLFLAKHRQSLKRLSLSQAQGYYALSLAEYTDTSLQLETYPNLRQQLMEIKLEYMRVDCFVFNQRFMEAWSYLERDFIKSQQHLRSLELQVLLRSSSYRLDQLLPACESTLERLEVTANYYHPNVFNCSTISTFKKLEVCHIYQRNSLPPYTRWPTSDKLLRVCDLPRSIVNLHLAQLPKIVELKVLRRKLFKVERISYECRQMDMSSIDCFHFILEHLKFPILTELRMYHCSCTEAMNILNKQDGIICFTEDVDCLIVLVDRSEFDYKTKMEYLIA